MTPRLVYSVIVSLDGYHSDRDGSFAWAEPDEEVHAFVNERERGATTYLYGRRMYEMMTAWETDPELTGTPGPTADFAAIWQAADKIVYSTTLDAVSTSRTRLEREFDPDAVRGVIASAGGDVGIGGPGLAAHALRAGLVDELDVYLCPVVVGGGSPYLPADVHLDLRLREGRRFAGGVVYLRYDVARD
ncbi:dihydrofolate reductase family protein [Pseudonocardia sp. KRD291]|uniref:dihydrofolate reductase family protein n=1 Tax=Pseudonocardia sp. KRD291 TaxID=2792007 RepID=UPI001C49DB24|nr:dihydrofolate reductase family protein [Pseudonocardia sp. KRD291]MBW0104582.1 dihydrofolate reductase family protein [Pseudonocardia sp. KRD291]